MHKPICFTANGPEYSFLPGKTGYLGEYELSSIVSEQVANVDREMMGQAVNKDDAQQ